MDPGHRAALALAVPLGAAGAAALGSLGADGLGLTGVDERYVAVLLPAALTLIAGRTIRPGTRLRTRVVLAVLAAPLLATVAWPRATPLVTWLTGGALVMGAEATVHAAAAASRLARGWLARVGLAALAGVPALYLLAAAAVVTVNTQLAPAPVRLFHQSPTLDPGETLIELDVGDARALRATRSPAAAGPIVVLHHGVSDGRERFLPWARRLRGEGIASVRLDARAHGRSDGAVCTYGQREAGDLVRVVAQLHRAEPERPVVVVGTSMGGGTVLAASRGLRGAGARALIALAPASRYRPLVDARTRFLGPLRDRILNGSARLARAMGQTPMTDWAPADRLDARIPVLVLHGVEDATIPLALSQRLAREHPNVTLRALPGVGHDDIPGAVAADDDAWSTVQSYLRGPRAGDGPEPQRR